jgi:excisionase family DNA binding protein
MSRTLHTLKETAEILNVPYTRAAELARQGILPVVRLGRQYRVDPERLSEFIANGGRALPGGWRREAA